jgi:tetratricopeptide (TPR) repeat protein
LLAHLEVAAGALNGMMLVAVTQPDARLTEVPLHDALIRIDPYVNEWHRTFERAGPRQNELTSVYHALALAMQSSRGVDAVLRSYGVTERERRRLFPFPHLDRPRMTPAVILLLVALHNLFWLVRNRRTVAWDEGEGNLQTVAADVVLAPLSLLARTDAVDVGDLVAITELSRWALAVLYKRSGQPNAPVLSGRQENAEIWLAAAVKAFQSEFDASGFALPRVVVSIVSTGRFRLPAILRLGHPFGSPRWHLGASGSMVVEIPIDTNLKDPLEVLRALKHQLIHAALWEANPVHRHGASFRDAASALGMVPSLATPWTVAGLASALEIATRLGPYPRPGPDVADAVADELAPSILAVGTFSPIARIESAVDGLATFGEWADAWPGLRQFLSAPEAVLFRRDLASRLAPRLAAPGVAGDRIASFLDVLATMEGTHGLDPEHWFDFVAGLLVAMLGSAPEDAPREPSYWRPWAQEAHGRSLAYLTGRLARVAEDLAAQRGEHEYPALLWRWRDIARDALLSWLDAHGYPELCLGHWLEGLLAGSDTVPTLLLGRRVSGFGLAEIVGLWQRSGKIANDRMARDSAAGMDAALQARLAACRVRLAELPAMQELTREARHFDFQRPALPGRVAPGRLVTATLVRYAGVDATQPKQEQSAVTAADMKQKPVPGPSEVVKLAVAFRDRALYLAGKGEHDRAIQDYNEALRYNPKDAVAYHNRGLSYAAKGERDRAIQDYNAALKLNPSNAAVFNNRGLAWVATGHRDRAIRDFDESIRLNPKVAAVYHNRGRSYAAKGDRDRAMRDYDEGIRLDPNHALAYRNRGQCHAANGDHDQAVRDYSAAIKLNPKDAIAYHNRGLSFAAKGEVGRAIKDYDEAIKLNPKDVIALNNRGLAHAARGDRDRAIDDYNEAIRLNPKDGLVYFNRGAVYENSGDRARAKDDYNTALSLGASADDRRGQKLARDGLTRLEQHRS